MTFSPLYFGLGFGTGILLIAATLGIRLQLLLQKSDRLVSSSKAYSRIVPQPTATIMVLGDSTAVGTGATPETSIAGRLGALFPTASIYNYGVNGNKIQPLVVQMDALPVQKADLLIVQIGANDITRFTPLERVRSDLRILLSKAAKISDKVVVLHSGSVGGAPLLFPLGFRWNTRTQEVREIYIEEIPKTGAVYVDLVKGGVDAVFASDTKRYYSIDKFHPSGDGYGVWFAELEKTLKETYGPTVF